MKDKLFFFVNGERNRRDAPTGVSADGTTGPCSRKPADAERFRDLADQPSTTTIRAPSAT